MRDTSGVPHCHLPSRSITSHTAGHWWRRACKPVSAFAASVKGRSGLPCPAPAQRPGAPPPCQWLAAQEGSPSLCPWHRRPGWPGPGSRRSSPRSASWPGARRAGRPARSGAIAGQMAGGWRLCKVSKGAAQHTVARYPQGEQQTAQHPQSTRTAPARPTQGPRRAHARPTFSILSMTGGGLEAVTAAAISAPVAWASARLRPGSSTKRESAGHRRRRSGSTPELLSAARGHANSTVKRRAAGSGTAAWPQRPAPVSP